MADNEQDWIELEDEPDFTATAWFSQGERIRYDTKGKRLLSDEEVSSSTLKVFRRLEDMDADSGADHVATYLPGFPDGSFGWARVLPHLPDEAPKLFVEYVGQGDSDKPTKYRYSTIERADLVEAHWRELGVRSVDIVAFDYSAIVTLELLARQIDRLESGEPPDTIIKSVLIANGGLFADGHSHPWFTTPLLKTPFGRLGTWFAQRSRLVFGQMVDVLWSKEYGVTKDEVDELFKAITRRNGAAFLSNGARFVDEHKANAKRWNFKRIYLSLKETVSFLVVGSEQDPFEKKQIVKAHKRLGKRGLDIRILPGGHLTTSEQPEALAELIASFVEPDDIHLAFVNAAPHRRIG